jgi:glutamate synthase (NADPH/NADH) small chain
MGKPTGFMEFARETPHRRPVAERLQDWREHYSPLPDAQLRKQGARCMDCGIPFCHQGCPLGNIIPDWNDLVYRGRWREALDRLHATNNFPEFTGRLCPAPCESSCVCGINGDAVAIKQIEWAIIERGWAEGWINPEPPATLTGKKVAVIGSGPSGLACAQQLCRAGHEVTLFERSDRLGGLMRYGIPEFKMEKQYLERRLAQMAAEGVVFRTGAHIGVNVDAGELRREFDALVLCGGASAPRDLPIPGRDLAGIHFAVPYLTQSNRRSLSLPVDGEDILAGGLDVVIIGGGDTGADCLGTAHRQGCRAVHQFEIVPRPPDSRMANNPWPQWDNIFRVSSAHEEGGEREYQINTKEFVGDANGHVEALRTVRVEMVFRNGRMSFEEIPDSEEIHEAQLVLLAMGFVGSEPGGMLDQLGVKLDPRGNVGNDPSTKQTNVEGVFAAGDQARGQSLIVWAIAEGRHAAWAVDDYLMGTSALPRPLEFGNGARPFV